MLTTKTPDNIDSIPLKQIPSLVSANYGNIPGPAVRMKILRMVFDILGYDLSSDLAFALCSEPTAELVLSTAGGGKTTGAQIKAICEKIWRKGKSGNAMRGSNILCLVYNRHNIAPMEEKHREMVSRLRLANIKGLDIDDKINANTMHSFCDQWRKEYVAELGLIKYTLLQEDEAERLMNTVLLRILQKYNIKDKDHVSGAVLQLHNLARESLCSISDLKTTDKFIDIELDENILEEIVTTYEKMKSLKKKYDFTDMLVGVYKLFVSKPEVLQRVQKYFDYIIADEIQDFTPIMLKILHILVSDGTPLMCIGDDDQSIYKFRGADIYHTLNFADEFDGGEVYLLSRNRRCSAEVLKLAKQVIGENTLRYNKRIHGIKDGGLVEYIPYTSVESENINVLSKISQLSQGDLADSVVCYRERVSSLMITELLEENRIPFNVIGGYGAFSHELYRHVIQVLNLLELPMDPFCLLNLYKCTPMKKQQVYDALGYDAGTGKFKTDRDKVHFSRIDFGSAMSIKGLDKDLEFLAGLSYKMQKAPMIEYFDELFNMIKKYFWNFQKSMRNVPAEFDDFIEEKIYKMFNSEKTFSEVFADYSKRKRMCEINQTQRYGIKISTFHGLKGLEFKNVYILDLANSIFPNYSYIDSKEYDEQTKLLLKECETCLYYVAVTRAKENLYLYYNETDPSRYVSLYNPLAKKVSGISEEDYYYKVAQQERNLQSMHNFEQEKLASVSKEEDIQVSTETSEYDVEETILEDEFDPFSTEEDEFDPFSDADTSGCAVAPILKNESSVKMDLQDTSNEKVALDSFEVSAASAGEKKFGSYLSNLLDF